MLFFFMSLLITEFLVRSLVSSLFSLVLTLNAKYSPFFLIYFPFAVLSSRFALSWLEFMYIRGFTKFGIKVLWRLQFFIGYRTLNLKFQKARTSLAETASWADSGQLQFWSEPSEILNSRSSNTPKTLVSQYLDTKLGETPNVHNTKWGRFENLGSK